MTTPTPTGLPSTAILLATPAAAALPSGWQSKATTTASFNATVEIITEYLGDTDGETFRTWYTAAWKKDPSLTPDQALAIWVTGNTIGSNAAAVAAALGAIPQAAATGAEKAVANLGGGCQAPSLTGTVASAGTAWIGYLVCIIKTDAAKFAIRAAQVALGLILVAVGTAHITHAIPAATAVAKKVGAVAALA